MGDGRYVHGIMVDTTYRQGQETAVEKAHNFRIDSKGTPETWDDEVHTQDELSASELADIEDLIYDKFGSSVTVTKHGGITKIEGGTEVQVALANKITTNGRYSKQGDIVVIRSDQITASKFSAKIND